jgi:hypothetical protein
MSAKKISSVRSLLNVSPRATAVCPASLLLEASRYALWREGKRRDEAKALSHFQPLCPRPTDAAMCGRRRVGSRFVRKRGRAAIPKLLRVGPHRRRPLRTSLPHPANWRPSIHPQCQTLAGCGTAHHLFRRRPLPVLVPFSLRFPRQAFRQEAPCPQRHRGGR